VVLVLPLKTTSKSIWSLLLSINKEAQSAGIGGRDIGFYFD
jgi:hypothetical protein